MFNLFLLVEMKSHAKGLLSQLRAGIRLYDRRTGRERLVQAVESRGQIVFLSFKHPQTGAVDRQPFSLAELQDRFEILAAETSAFRAGPEVVSLVAEAHRLEHAYLFNPLFATETSLIDLSQIDFEALKETLGEYVETMQVVAPDATNSPQTVTMRLQVWRLVGDTNWDGSIDIEDLQRLIGYLFSGMPGPVPTWEVADTNCDGSVDISDVSFLIDHMFISLAPICTNP